MHRGDNGELRVGVRRLARQQSPMPSSVISSQSMHLGVLATASHAVTTQTLFVVYYKPRFGWCLCLFSMGIMCSLYCPVYLSLILLFRTSQFIISLNKYLEAVNYGFAVGMRFKMRFEGEDSPERRYLNSSFCLFLYWFVLCLCCRVCLVRFTGTIVGIGDISPQWSNSKWRSLKVEKIWFLTYKFRLIYYYYFFMLFSNYFSLQIQWDEPATIQRPERVSSWDIEPFVASASLNLTQPPVKIKRPRPLDLPVAGRRNFCLSYSLNYSWVC